MPHVLYVDDAFPCYWEQNRIRDAIGVLPVITFEPTNLCATVHDCVRWHNPTHIFASEEVIESQGVPKGFTLRGTHEQLGRDKQPTSQQMAWLVRTERNS